MGIRLITLFAVTLAIIVAGALFYAANIVMFCHDKDQIDLKFFKINCQAVPNKQAELENTFSEACRIFNTTYNCDFRSINQVQLPYSEFGNQPRNYTLTEICRLQNAYMTDYACAGLCGCRISGF
jgi:hypothetical protein